MESFTENPSYFSQIPQADQNDMKFPRALLCCNTWMLCIFDLFLKPPCKKHPPPLALRFSRGKMGVSGAQARDNETLSLVIFCGLHTLKGLFPSRVLIDSWERFWGVCWNLSVRSAANFAGGPWRGWLESWRHLSCLHLWPLLFQCLGSCSNSRN